MSVRVDLFLILNLLIVAIILFSIIAWYLSHRAQVRAWTELAEQLGLTCEASQNPLSKITVSGVYRSRQVWLGTITRGSGKHRHTYTRVVSTLNGPAPFQMELYQQSIFSSIAKAVGMQDIELGDANLDPKYVIKGQPVVAVQRALLSMDLRQRLLEMPALHLMVTGQEVTCEKHGIERDANRLRDIFDLVSSLADQVERETSFMG